MTISPLQSSLSAEDAPASAEPAGYPFRGPGTLARATPFAVVAVLAEASLVFPPGPSSAWPVVVNVVLLAAVAAAFLLPWPRLPAWMSVLVPLAYTGSVLALLLAAGPTSGAGIVILIPLVWAALFHRRWESAVLVAAIVTVEVIISLTPVAVPDMVIARRVLLWALLGTLISVATHDLRDRIRRSQEETAGLQDRLRERSILDDRERIANDLRDKVIQRIFAAGLSLEGAATLSTQPEVRRRVGASVGDLDQAVRILRNTIFSLDHQSEEHSFHAGIMALCGELSPAPEVTFTGPSDAALCPADSTRLLEILRDAFALISQHATPARVSITADSGSHCTIIEAAPLSSVHGADGTDHGFLALRDRAAQARIRLDIDHGPHGARFAWHVPAPRHPATPSHPGELW